MTPQLAAGAVVWREGPDGPEVLLVERTKHRDVSLPKGKLDPGETLPECAAREVREETGIAVTLGAPIGTSEYRLPTGQDKVVYYWVAEADDEAVAASDFSPNDEIMALHWLGLDAARDACTYRHDRDLVDRLVERLTSGTARTFAIVALRHGKAADADARAADADRRLTKRGRQQAEQIAPGIAAFGVRRIIASKARRCLDTVAPLASTTGLDVRTSKAISQDSYDDHGDVIVRKVRKAIDARRTTVLCSHLPVIPAIVSAVAVVTGAAETPSLHRASMLHSADFSVVHVGVDTPTVLHVETHSAPL